MTSEAPEAWLTTPITADLVRGALELEPTEAGLRPHRLPAWARAQVPDGQLAMAEVQPSGVRLVLRTTATALEVDVLATKMAYRGAPPRPDGVYDLLVDGALVDQQTVDGGHLYTVDMATGTMETTSGSVGTLRFSGLAAGEKHVEVWLPHNEPAELVALRSSAPVEPARGPDRPVWVHHGSSISQGSNAASPSKTWPALAAAGGGVELVNLGFGGSALLDPFTARTIRETPADLVSIKIGINLVNTDVMRLRAFGPAVHGFLDTIREGHPTTPLLVISPLWCEIHEETPGPAEPDLTGLAEGKLGFVATGDASDPTRLTLRIIREQLADIVSARAASDPHLHLLDGRELYGEADAVDLPLPDQLHPDTETHRLIGERFATLAFGARGPFGRRS